MLVRCVLLISCSLNLLSVADAGYGFKLAERSPLGTLDDRAPPETNMDTNTLKPCPTRPAWIVPFRFGWDLTKLLGLNKPCQRPYRRPGGSKSLKGRASYTYSYTPLPPPPRKQILGRSKLPKVNLDNSESLLQLPKIAPASRDSETPLSALVEKYMSQPNAAAYQEGVGIPAGKRVPPNENDNWGNFPEATFTGWLVDDMPRLVSMGIHGSNRDRYKQK